MGYKKIVFIRCAPLSKLVYESVFIGELLEKGFEVEYLDTTLIYSKGFASEEYDEFDGIVKINSIRDFKKYLENQNNQNTLFIDLVKFKYRGIRILLLLKKYNFKLGFFARYAATRVNAKTNFKQKLNGLKAKLKNRIGLRFAYFLKKVEILKTYDFIFAGGNKAISFFFNDYFYSKDRKEAKIIHVNANDYDRFLQLKIKDKQEKPHYLVFLDQYLPYHPDFIIHKRKSINPESYYKELNKKFSEIEEAYNLKVIIAAHPKAISYKTTNPFDGRKVIFGKTIELVANSTLVLAHYSTSINFAVLYNKPILFLLNNEFKEVFPLQTQIILSLSKQLNCPISYLEETFNVFEMKTGTCEYLEYKHNYMTSPECENRLTIDIFTEFLQHHNSN